MKKCLRAVVAIFFAVGASYSLVSHAAGNTGLDGIAADVSNILRAAGMSPQPPREPRANVQQPPRSNDKVKSTAVTPVTADVTGLIIRFGSEDVKRLSRANQPPPPALIAEVARLAEVGLTFSRAMSMDFYVFSLTTPMSFNDAQLVIDRIKKSSSVEAIEVDARVHSSFVPNDTNFNAQWNMQSPTVYPGATNLERLWDFNLGRGSSSSVVAVIDSGVRPHPDFAARLLPGYDFISDPLSANDGGGRDANADDPGDGSADNECRAGSRGGNSSWHGTHVTGIIAATGNNAMGVAGVNWNTKILPIRALGKCGGNRSDIVDAMFWASGFTVPGVPTNPNPATVINMSLGGASPNGCDTTVYQPAINQIKAKGVLIVVAAGNESAEAGKTVPASCQGVLVVAAVGPWGTLAPYSNFSEQNVVDISAPGGDMSIRGGGIYSTIDSGTKGPVSYTYGYQQGTSMAAPHVAGIASMMDAVNPNMAPELKSLAMAFGVRAFPAGSDCDLSWPKCGYGIIDAFNSVVIAETLKPFLMIYELQNTTTGRYFRTGVGPENSNVLTGTAGPGWIDTKDYFIAWKDASQGASPVCRFNSREKGHFYTQSAVECAAVKRNPDYQYEQIAFYAKEPAGQVCPSGTKPIYRAFNNKQIANHRYTTQLSNIKALVAQGWSNEGVQMCAAS